MKYEIVSIDKLIPLEQVFPTHLANLEEMIEEDGFVLKAIIADKKTGTVMDGSHRYVYFLKNGYKEVPVFWSDYDDENVRVGTHLSHRFLLECVNINKEECRRRALTGELFSPRTTRHFFAFRKSDISLPLSSLKRGEPADVSHLIADVEVSEEIAHNEKFIIELNEEVDIVINYLNEVLQTKLYLTSQIERMNTSKKVAFFPGKFHPPHIGHIHTLLTLLPQYSKLIIGVSEHQPEAAILTPDEIQASIESFFKDYDNVEVCRIKGVLVEKENLDDLPEFDVLLSGNEDVLEWAKKQGLGYKFVPRSVGYLYSGTEIRTAFDERKK